MKSSKLTAPQIRAKVRKMKFGETLRLKTRRQIDVAYDESWRIRPIICADHVSAEGADGYGYLFIRTH